MCVWRVPALEGEDHTNTLYPAHMDRVLLVARYSGDDEAGAMERQRQLLSAWLAESDCVLANGPGGGWVEDETVSGAVHLDDRPSLGQWLRPPLLDEWDMMVVTEQDRVTRDDLHWWAFVGRLIEWGKRLVVLDDPTLDLSTPNGRLIAGVKATQAANYREDVRRKARNARKSFREQRRFAGGHWPFGYRAVPRNGAEGWELVPDPQSSKWVREAVDRVLSEPGDSLAEIVRDWIQRGVPTAREHQANTSPERPGAPPRRPRTYTWNSTSLRRILLSPTLLGYQVHRGEIVREDGMPVQMSEPIITPDEARALHEKLARRAGSQRGRRINRSELLGVVYCSCGSPMHALTTRPGGRSRTYRYYRCGRIARPERGGCPDRSRHWPLELVRVILEDSFLIELGDEEIQRRRVAPGINHASEIESLRDAIDNLSANLANLPAGSRAAQAAIDKLSEYERRLDELEARPVTPPRVQYIGTGRTYRQWWEETTEWSERGAYLIRVGVRLELGGTPEAPAAKLYWPDDLVERAGDAVP